MKTYAPIDEERLPRRRRGQGSLFRVIPLFLILPLASCGRSSKKEETAFPPAKVTFNSVEFPHSHPQLQAIQTTEARPFEQSSQRLSGQLLWNEDCTNRVFSPVAGRVEKIIAQVGQHVDKGDDLALMRSPDYGQAQADYRKAVGDFAQVGKTLSRVKALHEHGAAADKDVEGAQADYERALAEKQRAELRLQMLGAVGGEFSDLYHVVAPVSGIVVDKNVNLGQEVRSDMMLANSPQFVAPMFTITDPSKLWIQIDVPESELGKLRPNQPVELRTPAYPERLFGGKIEVVGASLDPQTRVAHARASVENAENLLKAGMYVSLDVKQVEASKTEVALPARAVIFLEGKYYVFVETDLNRFEKREVTVDRDPAGSVVVVSGVQAGEQVVSEGSLLLNDMLPESESAADLPKAN